MIEAIAVCFGGSWMICNYKFQTDPHNYHRKIYPMTIKLNNITCKFKKSTRTGRTMYEVVSGQ